MHMPTQRRGFTLIEILVSIAIMAVLAAIVAVSISIFVLRANGAAAALDLIQFLDETRTLATDSFNDTAYGVHLATTSATRFTGSSYTAGAPTNVVLSLASNVSIINIALSGGGADVVFNKLTGTTTKPGTFTVREEGTSSTTDHTVTIYATGVAELK
jgi:prepilin-type N-terminal cleavage/methylation domain-containing protein